VRLICVHHEVPWLLKLITCQGDEAWLRAVRRQRGALLAGAVQNSPSPPPTHRVRRGDGGGGTPDRAEDVVRVAGVDVGADGEEEDEEDDDGRYHTPLRLHADDVEGDGDGAEAVVAAVRALEGKVAPFEAAAATARARRAAAAALEEEEARLRGRVDELEAALAAAVAALAAARNDSEDEEEEKNAEVEEERSQAVDAATRRAEAAEAAATAARESLQVPPADPCLATTPSSYTITAWWACRRCMRGTWETCRPRRRRRARPCAARRPPTPR